MHPGPWAGVIAGSIAALAVTASHGATMTWDGDGPDDNWSALSAVPGPDFGRTNWAGALLRPANGDDLVFAGTRRLANRNDYALLSVRHLSFAAGAGRFVLGGNTLLLQGDITNASSERQTLDLGLTLTGASRWDGGSAGLAVRGAVNVGDTQLALQRNVTVEGGTRSWVVGDTGNGSLSLASGSTLALAGMAVGIGSGSVGQVTLDGSTSRITYTGTMELGRAGHALLTLSGGATLDGSTTTEAAMVVGGQAGSRGQIVLSGAGTRWLSRSASSGNVSIGAKGEGRVLVEGGAQWLDAELNVGEQTGAQGFVTVAGAGSALRTGGTATLASGGGRGELLVTQGGSAAFGLLKVGASGEGRVTVTGSGSVLDAGLLLMGLEAGAKGWVDVQDGGRLDATALVLTATSGTPGEAQLVVTGAGTLAKASGAIVVGGLGQGRLAVRQGALLESGNARFGIQDIAFGAAEVVDGGRWLNHGEMLVGDRGGAQLVVASGGRVETATLVIGALGRVDLAGGLLRTGSLAGSGRLSFTGGTLHVDGDTALATPLPAALTLRDTMRLEVGGTLSVGSGTTLTLAGGRVAAPRLQLDGGRIASADGGALDLAEVQWLEARGRIDAAIRGGAGTEIRATGALVLGDASRADGFRFDGELRAGGQSLELMSADVARLGFKTTLEHGAALSAAHGLQLAEGARLVALGDVLIDGMLQHEGTLASLDGTLTLRRQVSGAGGFDGGSFVFLAGYDTGAGIASVDFGQGDASFAAASTLTLKIGQDHDRLTRLDLLDFQGRLRLVFDGTDDFRAGAALPLLQFGALEGGFDRGRIVVSGFDAGRLDFSRLNLDGTLLISAVPAPASAWTLLAGLLALAGVRRRARPAP